MTKETINEITLWLLDRVAQGKHEEAGSIDAEEFDNNGETIGANIIKDEDGEYAVWLVEGTLPDFYLQQDSSEDEIRLFVESCLEYQGTED